MRFIHLLLAVFCLGYGVGGVPVESLYNEAVSSLDYSSLLTDFHLSYSEELQPLVSLSCALLDYSKVMLFAPSVEARHKADSLSNSLCSQLPQSERLDMSFMEKCFEDKSCMLTYREQLLLGLTPENDFFYYFNISQVPAKEMVASCLMDEKCNKKNAAVDMMNEWQQIVARCESESQEQEQQLVEAVSNVNYNSYTSVDNSMMPEVAQASCLRKTVSNKVKKAITKSLNTTAVCTQEMQSTLLDLLENNYAAMEVSMQVSRKLMECDNKSIAASMHKMLTDNKDNFKAGYAIWETIKMMNEENAYLKRSRRESGSHRETLDNMIESIASNQELAHKWNSNPYVWRWSQKATPDYFGNDIIYSAVLIFDPEDDQPITFKFSEVYGYPPYENHISFAVETELLSKILEIVGSGMESVEDLFVMAQKMLNRDFVMTPFKLSSVFSHNDFDYSNEQIVQMGMTLYSKGMEALAKLQAIPPQAQLLIDNMGDTDASFNFHYSFTSETNVELQVEATAPDGTTLFTTTANIEATENDLGEAGFKLEGTAQLIGDASYKFQASYQPMGSEFDSVDKRCEMSMQITDSKTGEEMFSWSSCTRPIYMMSEEDIVEQMSNVYQVIQVPDMLKLNFTLDFGENGLFGMLSSPKVMSLAVDYMDMALVEMGIKMRIVDDGAREAGDGLMMKTETTTYMSIPMLSRKMSLEVTSNIYDDMSLNNDYHLSTESYDDYTGEFVSGDYKGLADLYPCEMEEPGSDLMSSLTMMAMGTSETPERFCYDMSIELPLEKGGVIEQHFDYDTYSGNVIYNMDIEFMYDDIYYKEYANFSMEYGVWSSKHSILEPRQIEYEITNRDIYEIPFTSTNKSVQLLLSTESGLFLILNSTDLNDEFKSKPTIFTYSFLDYDYTVESLANKKEANYLLCSVEGTQEYEHVLQCNAYCEAGFDALLNLTVGYVNTTMKSSKFGTLKAYVDMSVVELAMYNGNSTQFANMSAVHDAFEIYTMEAFYRPMNATSAAEMCKVVDYQYGYDQMHSDDQCVQDMLNDPKWSKADEEMMAMIQDANAEDASTMMMEWVKEVVPDWSMETFDTEMLEEMFEMLEEYLSPYGF